jgi:YegS/Rv2252/BmrU family lipid kinase
MRLKLIVNPQAGRNRSKELLPAIEDKLRRNGCHVDSVISRNKGDTKSDPGEDYETVIACGGDGTVNDVVNGIADRATSWSQKFGIIPLGTVNLFAKELGIPEDPLEACDLILDGNTREIDLGRAGEHYFTMMAGVGFDAEVVDGVPPEMKRFLGPASYPLTAIKTLVDYDPALLSIEIDGGPKRSGYLVIVSNAKSYGYDTLSVAPHADMSDGLLDVCIFKKKRAIDILRYTLGVFTRTHTDFDDVETVRAKKAKVVAERPVLVHTDCEVVGNTPMEFTILPKALKIITPRVPR